jgi:exoribonuclease R
MFLDANGNVVHKKVYESMIVSDARLTYKEVQEIVDGKKSI